jgi:hypothetical protein
MVKSYNDPAKQKTREKFREFIRKHIKKSFENVRVVCFPGAEVKGEEALEIKEIYDVLGIPRENIVGLEYDEKAAKKLRKAKLGIEVIQQDAYNFFKNTDRKFDIISLDYTGQRSWREKDITRFIAGKGLLDELGIYCTNYHIRREGKPMKQRLLEQRIWGAALHHLMSPKLANLSIDEKVYLLNDLITNYNKHVDSINRKEIDLDVLREAITIDNLQIITCGRQEIDPASHLLINHRNIEIIEEITKDEIEKIKGIRPLKGFETEEFWRQKITAHTRERDLMKQIMDKGLTEEESYAIVRIQVLDYQNGRSVRGLERYFYTSNKNANMLFDIMAFKPFSKYLARGAFEILSIYDNKDEAIWNPRRYDKKKLRKKIERLVPKIQNEIRAFLPETIYLGSSYSPRKRISKDEAIKLLKEGLSIQEILDNYAGFKEYQLRGYKAHHVTGMKATTKA